MEQSNWLQLIRHNCSQLLSQAISHTATNSKEDDGRARAHHSRQPFHRDIHSSGGNHSGGDDSAPHRPASSSGHHLFAGPKHSLTLEPVNSSLYQMSESVPPDEQLTNLLAREMLKNSKRLDTSSFFRYPDPEDNDTRLSGQDGDFPETLSPQQEHIIQSHSESARNALIYIAVILLIYLVAVVFIAVQYYRKHSTLDPVTAYILRRSTRRPKDGRSSHSRKHRRRYSASGSGLSFENTRSMGTSSSLGMRNGSSSGMNGDSCAPGTSTTSGGVRFEQQAIVYGENGTTIKTIDPKCPPSDINGKNPLQPLPPPQSHQVSIQINIEHVLDDEIEESNVEDDYYDEDEEEDEEDDDEEEEEEDEFEAEEMAVLATNEADNSRAHPSKAQRLKNLFTHFHSHSTENKCGTPNLAHSSPGHQNDNHLSTINNGKMLTRSSSLQATDVSCPTTVGHIDTETGSWKPSEIDLLKFKRSSIAGFTVAASTGPLGMFKAQQRHYEETHL